MDNHSFVSVLHNTCLGSSCACGCKGQKSGARGPEDVLLCLSFLEGQLFNQKNWESEKRLGFDSA